MRKVLFINSIEPNCGVYQYGKRLANILQGSKFYDLVYCEPASMSEYATLIEHHDPIAVICNWHELTLPWFSGATYAMKHYGIVHEGSFPDHLRFDYYLTPDCTFQDTGSMFSLPRPLFEVEDSPAPDNNPLIISSFGFSFGNKGMGRVVKAVNDQFDKAIIRLHMPFAHYGDRDESSREKIYPGCYAEMKKSGIKLEITNNFMTDRQLLEFLSQSDLNIFLYDEMPGRGLSSVIDYALSVHRPIAISKTTMFRHIYNTQPSICYEDRSLQEIIKSGAAPLQKYRDKWSNQALIDKFEYILNKTL